MKIKILILILVLLITCGCSADVTLNISNGQIEESVSINYYFNDVDTKELGQKHLKKYYPAFYNVVIVEEEDIKNDGVEYYERILTDLGNGYNAKYKYKFDLLDYHKASTAKRAVKSLSILDDKKEKTITISTDSGGLLLFNNFPSLNNININIITSYKVVEHNADNVSGSLYTWNFSPGNNNKGIYIVLKTGEKDLNNVINSNINFSNNSEDSKLTKFANENPGVIIFIGFFLFFVIVIIISKLSHVKRDY